MSHLVWCGGLSTVANLRGCFGQILRKTSKWMYLQATLQLKDELESFFQMGGGVFHSNPFQVLVWSQRPQPPRRDNKKKSREQSFFTRYDAWLQAVANKTPQLRRRHCDDVHQPVIACTTSLLCSMALGERKFRPTGFQVDTVHNSTQPGPQAAVLQMMCLVHCLMAFINNWMVWSNKIVGSFCTQVGAMQG